MRVNWTSLGESPNARVALLVGAVVVAAGLRLPALGSSLGHDEAYTLEAFASQPYERIVTSYAAPNNHILHSVLVRAAVQLSGARSWTARLPAYIAGVLAVPLMYALARTLFATSTAGLIAAWLLAMMPAHISYSQVARGYSLSILLSILALLFARRAVDEGRDRLWVAFGLWGFLGAWTLPSGAFHVVSLGAWAALVAGAGARRKAVITTLATSAAIALAYLPIRAQLERAGGRWGIDVLEDPLALPGVFIDTAAIWLRGPESVVAGLAALGGLLLIARRRRDVAVYLALAWAVPPIAAAAMGVAGQPRSYLYLLPTFVLAATYGIVRVPTARLRAIAVVLLLCGYGWSAATTAAADDPYGELARYMEAELVAADLVVAPFIMDVRLWAYAKETMKRSRIVCMTARPRPPSSFTHRVSTHHLAGDSS